MCKLWHRDYLLRYSFGTVQGTIAVARTGSWGVVKMYVAVLFTNTWGYMAGTRAYGASLANKSLDT
jgi:hypothetical protein